MRKIILCFLILMQAYSNNAFSQNILPNYGFERYNKSIPNDKTPDGISLTCTNRNVIDSCSIFTAEYYNKKRAEDSKYYNRYNNLQYVPYRVKSCISLFASTTIGGEIDYTLKEPLKKDSVYLFTCYIKIHSDSIYTNLLNITYSNTINDHYKNNITYQNTKAIKPKQTLKNEYFYMKLSTKFKAKNDAKYFITFIDNRTTEKWKTKSAHLLIDNASLEKIHDSANLNVFIIDPLLPEKEVKQVFITNDTIYQNGKDAQIVEIATKKKDYIIQVQYSSNEKGLKRKEKIENLFKDIKYDDLRIEYKILDDKVLKNNVNILFY